MSVYCKGIRCGRAAKIRNSPGSKEPFPPSAYSIESPRSMFEILAAAGLSYRLAGYWSFEGRTISANTLRDLSGKNYNGTINGATATIGKLGQALSFNGTSSHVQLANSLIGTGSCTLCSRVKPAPSTPHTDYFLGYSYPSELWLATSHGNDFSVEVSNGGTKHSARSDSIVSSNKWYHLCDV